MPDVTIHRHGDRWAVKERGAESPVKEFPSRAAAELAAQQIASGGAVEVVEEDPTGLEGEPVAEDHDTGERVDAPERPRSRQAGL